MSLGGVTLLHPFRMVVESEDTTSTETSTALQCLLELSSIFGEVPPPDTVQLYKSSVTNCRFIELSTESTLVCLSRVVELANVVMRWDADYDIYSKVVEVSFGGATAAYRPPL